MIHGPVDMVMPIMIMDACAAFSGGMTSGRRDFALYDYSEREQGMVWRVDANGTCA